MLSHRNRFHGHGSLRYVYNHGKKARIREFGVNYTENENRVHSRFAVVVSKKVYKSAVKRNRIRRRMYELLRADLENFNKTYDVIITIFTPDIIDLSHEELKNLLHNLLVKEKLIS